MSGDYRNNDIEEAIAYIEEYLKGKVPLSEAARWGLIKISSEPYKDHFLIQDHILANAYGMLLMISESEPEEFRSTKKDIEEALNYLLGKKPFPKDRIPPPPKLS